MKHAGPKTLDRLEPLLAQIRAFDGLKEKSRGCFYIRGKGFLHFHEHGDDAVYADIGLGADFDRLPAMTASQHRKILSLTAKALRQNDCHGPRLRATQVTSSRNLQASVSPNLAPARRTNWVARSRWP